MKQVLLIKCLSLAFALIAFSGWKFGQEQPFRSVPESIRARLVERLNLLNKYQKDKKWEDLYSLLSTTVIQDLSKEDYVRINSHHYNNLAPDDLILNFRPIDTVAQELSAQAGWWVIYGCAELRKKGRSVWYQASVEAHREEGDWYFSEIGVISPLDGKPTSCANSGKAQRKKQPKS